ncbi:hypothetical protein AVEN_158635-1 [Araneus ventricosus]|uniref:C2H2-type domain-containing protein n=1 Tax=Araneus ventricosus TaxID=182803 RepID=A0A4Y2MUM1_ARAVE|nr:hypothetical protein AVEN_158635-1 [Araneus ventricosus]
MISILCFRCSQISISFEGLSCFYCDNDQSRAVIDTNFLPPVPETGNVSPSNYVLAADASTQTVKEDIMLLEPSREASTQTTDTDFNIPAQIVGRNGHENCTKKDCTSHEKTSQDFYQVSTAKKNPLPANPNRNEDDFHNQSYDIFNRAMVGNLIAAADEPYVASKQRTYIYEESSIDEYENKLESDGVLRRQGTTETTDYVNNVGKLDFAGSNLFQLENKTMNYLPVSSFYVEGEEKGNNPPVVSSFCRRNPSISKFPNENLVTTKTVAEQNSQTSYNIAKKCGKCRRWFNKEWSFYAHMQNNCDPNPFKCDKCDAKFPSKTKLMTHQPVHTGVKPFKCSQCDYASAWPCNLNKHLRKHTKR